MRQALRRGRGVVAVLVLCCGGLGPSAATAAVRFARVVPLADDSGWEADVRGLGAGEAVFFADHAPLPAASVRAVEKPAGAGEGTRRFSVVGVPAATRLLGVAGAGAKAPEAAVEIAAADPARVPWAGWSVYHVMVGMFRSGSPANDGEIRGWRHPNYAGGDLQGVRERLDYLRDLGVTAVWLSPIFTARTSHGYDVTNYFQVADQVAVPGDPVASLALFDALVADAHARGIRIVLDLPLNHANRAYDKKAGDPGGHGPRATPARQEAEKTWESWGAGYRYWDFDHAPTRAFLRGVARYWLTERKVDGLRLDYVRGIPHDFLAELTADLATARPGGYVVGECWKDADGPAGNLADIATYYAAVDGRPQLSSLLDFPLQMVATEVFTGSGTAADLEDWLQQTAAAYGPQAYPSRFLDNHDLSRLAAWGADRDQIAAAVGFLAALTGPAVIFYGTETALADASPRRGFTDAGRIAMPWGNLDETLRARVAAALAARRDHPVLGFGARLPLHADRDVLAMARRPRLDGNGTDATLLVLTNVAASARTVELALGGLASAAGWRPVVGSAGCVATEADRVRCEVPPRSTAVLTRAGG